MRFESVDIGGHTVIHGDALAAGVRGLKLRGISTMLVFSE